MKPKKISVEIIESNYPKDPLFAVVIDKVPITTFISTNESTAYVEVIKRLKSV